MANMIKIDSRKEHSKYLQMSNGLTDVLIQVLVLSGSKLARTVEEKRLIVWLAEKDQSKVGRGTVGFAISDLPWNRATFEADRAFLGTVVLGAKNRIGWEKLDYTPNEDLLFPCLDTFAELVLQMDRGDIRDSELEEWIAGAADIDPVVCGFPLCPKHHTLLTVFGCHICNN